jgi:hypothetical protein
MAWMRPWLPSPARRMPIRFDRAHRMDAEVRSRDEVATRCHDVRLGRRVDSRAAGSTCRRRNQVVASRPNGPWNYEGGMKATLMNGRARINVAAFQMDYTNLQVQTRLVSVCSTSATPRRRRFGVWRSSRAAALAGGLEREGTWRGWTPLTIATSRSGVGASPATSPATG